MKDVGAELNAVADCAKIGRCFQDGCSWAETPKCKDRREPGEPATSDQYGPAISWQYQARGGARLTAVPKEVWHEWAGPVPADHNDRTLAISSVPGQTLPVRRPQTHDR